MRHIALEVELTFLFLGGGRQRDHPEYARTDAFGQGLDSAPFTCAVASFKDDAHFQALAHHPALQLNQLYMQAMQLLFVLLTLKRDGRGALRNGFAFLLFFICHDAFLYGRSDGTVRHNTLKCNQG